MNSRNLAILTVIGLLIISVITFEFFKKVQNENAPAPVQPVARQTVESTPRAGYIIPKGAVHSLAEMKERIKKAEEERMRSQRITANTETGAADEGGQSGAKLAGRPSVAAGTSSAGAGPENAVPTANEINAQIKSTEEQLKQSRQIAAKKESEAESLHEQTTANPVGEPSPVNEPLPGSGPSSAYGSSPLGGYSPSGTSQPPQQGGSSNPPQSNPGSATTGGPSSGTSQPPSQQGSVTVNPQGSSGGTASGGGTRENKGGIITY